MQFTLGAAAQAAGVAKSTVSKAVRNGKLSAEKRDDGSYKIDAAELFRVFPKPPENSQIERSATPGNGGEHQFERERELLLDQIRHLREQLAASESERRVTAERLHALLSDSRAAPAAPDQRAAPARRWWRFGR